MFFSRCSCFCSCVISIQLFLHALTNRPDGILTATERHDIVFHLLSCGGDIVALAGGNEPAYHAVDTDVVDNLTQPRLGELVACTLHRLGDGGVGDGPRLTNLGLQPSADNGQSCLHSFVMNR